MKRYLWLRDSLVMICVWIALLLLFGSLSDRFLTAGTLGSIANRIPALAVVAVGMTFVILIAGIDLSVGSVLALCGAVLGVALVDWQWPLWAAMLISMAIGGVAGTVNGWVSVRLAVPSFIVTLGMLEIARGLAYLVTDSRSKYIGEPIEFWTRPMVSLGVGPAFVVALLVVAAGQLVLSRTVFGRHLVAIGTNEAAVRLAGINPRWPKIAVFAMTGCLTGLGAVFWSSRLGSSDPNAGVGFELAAIAAVVIGGTSLMGGRASVVNSFIGVLIIATLEAGLAQVGASEPAKRVITGVVIVAAVVLDAWRQHHLSGRRISIFRRC